MNIEAHAKINLSLNVVRKREDGYHELEMIMVPLTLCDHILLECSMKDHYSCNIESLLIDESNTVVKAVKLMKETYGIDQCFSVHMEKHIPMQAGLAGGSADAAAVMKGINELMQLQIPVQELSMLSKQVGADVPFCIYDTPAVVKGIGEDVRPIPVNMDAMILLVKPVKGVPTGKAFSMIDFSHCEHPDYRMVEDALRLGDYDRFCKILGNTLEQPAFTIVPEIEEIKQQMMEFGFDTALMSGSGSTVFGITRDQELANQCAKEFEKHGHFVCLTSIIKGKYKAI